MGFSWYESALRTEHKRIKARAEKFVESLINALQVGHKSIRPPFRFGVPVPHIVEALTWYQIDLVVLGARGVSGVRRFLLGSVSDWVLNEAQCSVLIVRGTHLPVLESDWPCIHILFATDGSSGACSAMRFLALLIFPPSSQITILHVFEALEEERPHLEDSIGMMEDWVDFIQSPEEILESQEQADNAVLKETRHSLKQPDLIVKEIILKEHVAEEIIQTAKLRKVDLVMLGTEDAIGRKGVHLGSVLRHVVRHAHCSVLVVRPRM